MNFVSEYTYTYDALGNITAISGSINAAYTYDNQSQLLSETLEGITTSYTYDSVGNIRSVSESGTTHTYTYGDAEWKDLLTAYDGHPITYDAIGNPLQWHDGRIFTWTEGRRLASSTGNGNVISYTYNADGLRLTKNVNGTEHRYTWQGSRLISEYRAGNTLEFFYDESGRPAAFRHNGAAYYYVTNLQGDITHILDANGNVCAEYSYNAWGRILSATGTMAAVNPLRYRGYYYDAETGLYYVSSRYYDPEICRFINEDGLVSTGKGFIGTNMFAYCNNCPVVFNDFNGTMMTSCVDDSIVGGKKKDPVYEFINGQHLPEYCNIPYGNSTLGYSGCEVIALFNMLILRGAGESLDSIISFMVDRYNKYPNLLSGWGMYGKFGAAPQDIAAFLGARGIDYQFTYSLKNLNKKGELGVYIVSFWNSNGPVLPVFSGYHTVAISYDGTDYVSYNLDCDKNLTFSSPSGLPYFLDGTGGYFFGFFVPNS